MCERVLNRIIAMCGDYYIGGRRFSSLSDLIGYYSYVSCLLKEEKLLSPVAPPEVRPAPLPQQIHNLATGRGPDVSLWGFVPSSPDNFPQ